MIEAKTILVVDDDHELRAGVQAVLQKHGYRTLGADDGMEAQKLINGERPDLVILDMMMPRWGGFLVLEHFQDKKDAPPFIMITGNDGKKHKQYAEQIGVVDYIHKPFPMDRLLEGVEKALKSTKADEAPAEQPRVSLRCKCAKCGARIKAPLAMLGQTRSCPGCRALFVVLPQAPDDEGPKLVALAAQPPESRQPW